MFMNVGTLQISFCYGDWRLKIIRAKSRMLSATILHGMSLLFTSSYYYYSAVIIFYSMDTQLHCAEGPLCI
jgi:hypothetical protein